MAVPEAVWCVACGAIPDVALTVEHEGVLAHYGSCWDHVADVAARARRDMRQLSAASTAALSREHDAPHHEREADPE